MSDDWWAMSELREDHLKEVRNLQTIIDEQQKLIKMSLFEISFLSKTIKDNVNDLWFASTQHAIDKLGKMINKIDNLKRKGVE